MQFRLSAKLCALGVSAVAKFSLHIHRRDAENAEITLVPWKRRRGYATEALRLLLPQVWQEGLTYVEITTDPDNIPSQRVIEANGGLLVERFIKSEIYGCTPGLRYRVSKEPQSL